MEHHPNEKKDDAFDLNQLLHMLPAIRKDAENGRINAQLMLAMCYRLGYGVEQDAEEAFKWFKLAADAGSAKAMYELFSFEEYVDWDEALEFLRKSAEKGYAKAQYQLGEYLYQNDEYDEAVKWLYKAAEQDHAQAQWRLGWCYEYDQGVEQDNIKCAKWYRKSAEQGNADGQWSFGGCCWEGRGVKQDYEEAVKWLEKAADQGHEEAMFSLETMVYKIHYWGAPVASDFPHGIPKILKVIRERLLKERQNFRDDFGNKAPDGF